MSWFCYILDIRHIMCQWLNCPYYHSFGFADTPMNLGIKPFVNVFILALIYIIYDIPLIYWFWFWSFEVMNTWGLNAYRLDNCHYWLIYLRSNNFGNKCECSHPHGPHRRTIRLHLCRYFDKHDRHILLWHSHSQINLFSNLFLRIAAKRAKYCQTPWWNYFFVLESLRIWRNSSKLNSKIPRVHLTTEHPCVTKLKKKSLKQI